MAKQQSKIVEAVGKAGVYETFNATDIEAVMKAAVDQAAADGITDPHEVLERKLAARQSFKDERRAAAAAQAYAEEHGISDPKEVEKFARETRERFEKQRASLSKPKGR